MNWNTDAFSAFPFAITAKNHFWTEHPEFDKKSGAEFSKLYRQAIELAKPVERDIRQCIAKWPNVAGFQWLLAEYFSRHDLDAMDEVLDNMVEKHPESYFSHVTTLMRVVSQDAEPPTFFGLDDSLELNELLPDRNRFHVFEVFLYEATIFMASYDVSRGQCDVDRHDRYLRMLNGLVNCNQLAALSEIIVEKHQQPEKGELHVVSDDDEDDDYHDEDEWEDDDDYEEWEDEPSEAELARRQRNSDRLMAIQNTKAPNFQLAITEKLYDAPLLLPDDLMQDLLAQDRQQLIADLELVLKDAVVRYQFYVDQDEEHYAVLHAIILLCHFESMNSLPALLDFLSQPEYVLDYWLDDVLNQNVPQWIAPMLQHNLAALDPLILDGDAFEFARIAAIAALEQFALHWPERKADVEAHLLQLLAAINDHDVPMLDQPTINSYIIHVAVSLKMKGLYEAMKPLFEQYKVDVIFIGSLKDAEIEFKRPFNHSTKMPIYGYDLHSKYHRDLKWLLE